MSNINKHSERFTNAVTKLYNAFHKGELSAWDCQKCAVGSMCNGRGDWSWPIYTVKKGDLEAIYPKESFVGLESNITVEESGYSLYELSMIESLFLKEIKKKFIQDKDSQFKGLRVVIKYLCELEGIPNIMDYTSLFETENNEPKHHLEEVFV